VHYSLDPFSRGILFGFLGVGALIAIGLWLTVVVSPPGQWIIATVWSLIIAGNAYRYLLRSSFELAVVDTDLEWTGAILHGRTAVSTLRRIRPSGFDPFVHVIERSSGRPVLVWANNSNAGFRAVCRTLQELRPGLQVRFARRPNL